MRVIAGSRKHLPLKSIPSDGTRPTTDRIKETLFNMISFEIPGARFLDLFAGSGQIGIEALSRGAASATIVENDRRAVECIKANLAFTKLEATVLGVDVFSALSQLAYSGEPFDIIFADPPYALGCEEQLLSGIRSAGILADEGLVIIEADIHTSFDFAEGCGFSVIKEKKYKTNKHVFLEQA